MTSATVPPAAALLAAGPLLIVPGIARWLGLPEHSDGQPAETRNAHCNANTEGGDR